MKLDRRPGGYGKYAVVRLRNMTRETPESGALRELTIGGYVEFGNVGDEDEFFVLKLKDLYAPAALAAYAGAAMADDPEYAAEVLEMARRAAKHPGRKKPD